MVLISADEFERLRSLAGRQTFYAWELPDDLTAALEVAVPPEFTRQYDHELDA